VTRRAIGSLLCTMLLWVAAPTVALSRDYCISYDNKSPRDDGGATYCILQYNLSYNNDGPDCFPCQFPRAGLQEQHHPIFCFNHLGDLERALLRNGNVASADEWRAVLEPVVARYRDLDIRRYFRGDAAFALAYNLGNFLRRLVLPTLVKHWTMTRQAPQNGSRCDDPGGRPARRLQETGPKSLLAAQASVPHPPGRPENLENGIGAMGGAPAQ
jgi:hypothetical protein